MKVCSRYLVILMWLCIEYQTGKDFINMLCIVCNEEMLYNHAVCLTLDSR